MTLLRELRIGWKVARLKRLVTTGPHGAEAARVAAAIAELELANAGAAKQARSPRLLYKVRQNEIDGIDWLLGDGDE